MKQENKYILSPFILIAFVLAITSEYCSPQPSASWPSIADSFPFNPVCYVKSFNPQPPEFGTNPIPMRNSAYYVSNVTASGTATADISPLMEIPELEAELS